MSKDEASRLTGGESNESALALVGGTASPVDSLTERTGIAGATRKVRVTNKKSQLGEIADVTVAASLAAQSVTDLGAEGLRLVTTFVDKGGAVLALREQRKREVSTAKIESATQRRQIEADSVAQDKTLADKEKDRDAEMLKLEVNTKVRLLELNLDYGDRNKKTCLEAEKSKMQSMIALKQLFPGLSLEDVLKGSGKITDQAKRDYGTEVFDDRKASERILPSLSVTNTSSTRPVIAEVPTETTTNASERAITDGSATTTDTTLSLGS